MEALIGLIVVMAIAAIVVYVVLDVWPGLRGRGPAPGEVEVSGTFVIRSYGGAAQRDVVADYVRDAEALAARGYEPVGQSWGDGQWDGLAFLVALILCLFGIGLILLAYMAIVRPEGTLLVTFRLRDA